MATVAEFKSLVIDTKSNTKSIMNRFQFIVITWVCIFGKLCPAYSSIRNIWTWDLLRITKTLLDVTNSL